MLQSMIVHVLCVSFGAVKQRMERIGLIRTMRNKTFPIGRNGYDEPVSASACVELLQKYLALNPMPKLVSE